MKDQAIQFLGNLPQNEGEQFNKALELYRKSKDHDAGKLRFYNTLGFNKERLESLLYDLKKTNAITDVEVALAAKPVKAVKKSKAPKNVKKLEVIDPVVVGDDEVAKAATDIKEEKDLSTPPDSNPEEVTKDEVSGSNDLSTPLEVTNDPNTDNNQEEAAKDPAVDDAFVKEVIEFDTETEKYNSIKSFAATLSNYIKEDPADQKAATLKAFIESAKKNFAPS